MRAFWDDRAAEDPYFFVDNRVDYKNVDEAAFWADGAEVLARFRGMLGFEIAPDDVVVEVGCGIGRITRALAAEAARVVAIDVSAVMLERARELNPHLANVEWVLGDGASLAAVGDEQADGCFSFVTFQHIPDPEITLGYIREMARVVKPGGWAAFQLSTQSSVAWRPRLAARVRLGIRARFGGPHGQTHPAWVGSTVPEPALRAAVEDAGLRLERVTHPGTPFTAALATKATPRARGG